MWGGVRVLIKESKVSLWDPGCQGGDWETVSNECELAGLASLMCRTEIEVCRRRGVKLNEEMKEKVRDRGRRRLKGGKTGARNNLGEKGGANTHYPFVPPLTPLPPSLSCSAEHGARRSFLSDQLGTLASFVYCSS